MDAAGDDALRVEEETRQKVSDSLSRIEVALSEWDLAKRKPKGLEGRISYLRRFHGLLSRWEKDSLKGRRDGASVRERLRRFMEICRGIESSGM